MTISLPLDDQEKMQAIVDRRHPAYDMNVAHWRFCDMTAKGGREWFVANIHQYMKEGTTEYSDRLSRAYRFNHTKEIVLLLTKYVFKQGIIRNTADASDAVQEIWKHATLEGSPIDLFMKQVSNRSSSTGRVWVFTDNKMAPGDVQSLKDEKDGKGRIYAYLVDQEDMLDFAYDEWGQLSWVLYRVRHRDDDNPVTASRQVNTRYVMWTKEEWIVLEETFKSNTEMNPSVSVVTSQDNAFVYGQALVDGLRASAMTGDTSAVGQREIKLVNRGLNTIGEVPGFPVNHIEDADVYTATGLVDDIAYLDRAVANYLSNLDAIIQDQTFSQLVIPTQGLDDGDEEYNKILDMGTKRIFTYNGDNGGNAPTYISPDSANAQIILSVIKTIIGEIYHSVGMAGERTKQDNAQGIDNSSGVAKAYDFDRMNAMLISKAAMLEKAENRLVYFVERWAGDVEGPKTGGLFADEASALVKYPLDYDVRGLPDEFDIAQSLLLVEAPDTVRRQQMQIIVDKLFPRLAKALKSKMVAEMQNWPVDPMDTLQNQLQIQSRFRMGPGETQGGIKTTSAPPAAGGATPSAKPVPGKKAPGKSTQGQNNG